MNRESLFSHIGGVIAGFTIGAIACYAMISPSIARIRATGEDAERRANAAAEDAMNCHAEKSRYSGGLQVQPSPAAQRERIDELTAALAVAKKDATHLRDLNGELTRHLIADGEAQAVNVNTATVLYEPAPPNQVQTVASAIFILAGKPLSIPGFPYMRPSWYVPGKVRPISYVGAPEYEYLWVDAHGGHEGPFRPLEYHFSGDAACRLTQPLEGRGCVHP